MSLSATNHDDVAVGAFGGVALLNHMGEVNDTTKAVPYTAEVEFVIDHFSMWMAATSETVVKLLTCVKEIYELSRDGADLSDDALLELAKAVSGLSGQRI